MSRSWSHTPGWFKRWVLAAGLHDSTASTGRRPAAMQPHVKAPAAAEQIGEAVRSVGTDPGGVHQVVVECTEHIRGVIGDHAPASRACDGDVFQATLADQLHFMGPGMGFDEGGDGRRCPEETGGHQRGRTRT